MRKLLGAMSRLGPTTLVLGLLTLVVLTIGRGLAIVALISVIGIPLYFLMAAIPPLFQLWLLAFGFRWALGRAGLPSTLFAFGLAAGTMVLVPWIANIAAERDVAALIAGDRTGPVEPWRGGTLAIVVPASRVTECGDFCQRALASGAVSRFIVARAAKAAPDDAAWPNLDLGAPATAYRLEQRGGCEPARLRDGPRDYAVAPAAAPAAPALRLAIARGRCLVTETAPASQADGLLISARIRAARFAGGGFDLTTTPTTAARLSFHRKAPAGFAEVWRQTSVRWAPLLPVLLPGFVHGYAFEIGAGFLRGEKRAGAPGEAPDIDAFVRTRLAMNLALPQPDLAAGREAALDAALSRPAALDAANQALVEDLFEGLGWNGETASPETLRRALALLKDARVAAPQRLANLVRAGWRGDAAMREAVAGALFDRLDAALAAPDPDAATRERTFRHLGEAVKAIPDANFGRHWARLRVIRGSLEAAFALRAEIPRARFAGATAAPDLLALTSLRETARQTGRLADRPRKVQHAALSGLCGMGPAAAFLLPEIESRLRDGAIVTQYPADWRMVANTLAALGGDPNLLRALVPPERILSHLVKGFDEAIDHAARQPRCQYSD